MADSPRCLFPYKTEHTVPGITLYEKKANFAIFDFVYYIVYYIAVYSAQLFNDISISHLLKIEVWINAQ